MNETPTTDEVVHEPDPAFAESTNVRRFMDEYGIENYDELIERTTGDIEGVDESGVDWFWDEVVAYVVTEDGVDETDDLRAALRDQVGEEVGKPFRPREVLFVDEFPKTQSGKIIRRAIQATYTGEDLGDMSSIENPDALDEIEAAR